LFHAIKALADGVVVNARFLMTTPSVFSSSLPIKPFMANTVKGKAVPLQAWTGPEGSRRLRPPDFKTIGT